MGQFEWKTGEPDKKGFYITTRESKLGGNVHRYVSQDYYATNDLSKYPLPKYLNKGWQTGVLDGSEVIAWCNIEDIEPFNE